MLNGKAPFYSNWYRKKHMIEAQNTRRSAKNAAQHLNDMPQNCRLNVSALELLRASACRGIGSVWLQLNFLAANEVLASPLYGGG